MKKVLFVVVLSLLMSSCSDEVVFNTPSVQGLMNTIFWRALQSKAVLSVDGALEVEAVTKRNLDIASFFHGTKNICLG